LFAIGNDASRVLRARSDRHVREAWGRLVDRQGEPAAFAQLAEFAGGSDAAYRKLDSHGILTDLS
jgi:hypothetical protein